jgi:hypothetical protein
MIARIPDSASFLLSARLGLVSIPGAGPAATGATSGAEASAGDIFDREETRGLLLALGRDLGLSAPVPGPSSDADAAPASADSDGTGADLDEAIRKSLEGLDAVWLDGGEVVAAFVIEARPGWEGLRRLADLLAIYPKLKVPLYAVSAPSLRAGLLAEIHRPVYRLLKRPLAEQLRFLDRERLRAELDQMGERVRYLKPAFLEGVAERLAPPGEG